jgi:hypothetical protein
VNLWRAPLENSDCKTVFLTILGIVLFIATYNKTDMRLPKWLKERILRVLALIKKEFITIWEDPKSKRDNNSTTNYTTSCFC